MALVESGEYGDKDDLGRKRLKRLSEEFHQVCAKVNRDQEIENLHWRVKARATGQNYTTDASHTDQQAANPAWGCSPSSDQP